MPKLKYTIETDQVCEIPGIGRLVPGVEHEISDYNVQLFKTFFNIKLGAGNFPRGTVLAVTVMPDEETEEV